MAPPRTTVRNDQILAAIDALSRQLQSRDEPLEARLDEVTMTLADVARRQVALEQVVSAALTKEAKRDTCPFRDEIVSAANNKGRIIALEKGQHAIELQVVKWGAAGGAAISTLVAVADRIIEALRTGGGA